ncbi:MAG TPA: Rieske 2Fe-2S domain-containing protein [Polyangiaceae bacterium]|nr:Rieske 2Fe-2S domain-containing protein [Polyangiaceae bacterium]
MNPRRLCVSGVERLALGEARVFEFERDGEQLEGFLLRHRAGLFAYVNRCPHWAVDLDLGDGRFYAADVDRIYCKNHGALFRVEDGMCDLGPCFGQALESFAVELEGDDAFIDLERPR